MKLNDKDLSLVWMFLKREAEEFNYQHWFNKHIYMSKMMRMIKRELAALDHGANYLHIESLTSLGLLDRKLILTPVPWNQKGSVWLTLPPNPRNGGMHAEVER